MKLHTATRILILLYLLLGDITVNAQQVRISIISNSIGSSPVWVADQKGFFKEEGLDVQIHINPESSDQLERLANGELEFTHQAVDHFMREIERGRNFVIVHNIGRPTFDLISRSDLKMFTDLKGMVVALDNVETGYWLLYRKVLQKYGVNPGDYTLLANLGGSGNRLKAIREDRAQFTHMNAPASIEAEREGFNVLTNLSDHYPNFPASSIGTRRDWARENPDIVVAYLRAHIRATEWLLDPKNRNEVIEMGVAIGHDRDLLPESIDRFINKGVVRFGTLTGEGINQVGNLLVKSHVIGAFGPMEKYADTSYQIEALRQLQGSVQVQKPGVIISLDPRLAFVVDEDAVIEKVAGGFKFTEGPVWFNDGQYLVFSDIPENKIYKWDAETGKASVYLNNSGFTGNDPTGIGREVNEGTEVFYNLGSNGITKDRQGRIVFNAMGDRAIVRIEKDGKRTVLADNYQGKRLNSTNDLVYNSRGWLYFTDPPSGLRGGDNDPDKQMDYNGVFMLKGSRLTLLTKQIFHPNGLTFSPDERYFFVNDNRTRKVYRFELAKDGTLFNMQVFVDMTGDPGVGNPDGMKFDTEGNMYAAGAGGIWVISPAGEHLGTIDLPERASNMTFGGEDARTLYVTARTSIYRIRVNIPGIRI